jgi:hypothetical protein
MNASDLEVMVRGWRTGAWWEREAALAWRNGNALIIPGRKDTDVYLARFWLSAAVRRSASQGGEAIESGESLVLHYFARGDDDEALHDHPWDFRTTILIGGYRECLPPVEWMPTTVDGAVGPAWRERTEWRRAGETLGHLATDLHCVQDVEHGTWTLVRTGPRVRPWGFHPPGQSWLGYRDFLGLDAAKATA